MKADPGTSGASFLKLGAGPRANAMGDAQTAVADDVYAGYWNPGGLSVLRRPELSLAYDQGAQAVSQQYVAYAQPLRGATVLGVNAARLAVGGIDGYDDFGAKTGTILSNDLAVGLTAAQGFTLPGDGGPFLGAGAGVKLVSERLGANTASVAAGDFGLLTSGWEDRLGSWSRGLRLGIAARNLGGGLRFVSQTTRLPATWAMGLALARELWGDAATFALDASKPNDQAPTVSFGAEYWLKGVLALRAGATRNSSEGLGVRAGLGAKLYLLQVDYAVSMLGALGTSHRVGLTLRLGGRPAAQVMNAEELVSWGSSLIKQGRYYEAIVELERALEKDPGDERAVELMRQARAALDREGKSHAP